MMKKLFYKLLLSQNNVFIGVFVIVTLLIGCQGNRSLHKDTPSQPPNILWIVAENIKLDLGCYGAKLVHTPNIDYLAEQGIRYTHVFSTSPVCAPSRSAFMTGMYQTTTDMHNMRSHRDDDYRLPEGVRPITHWLQDNGYFTANISEIEGKEVGTGKLDLNFVNEGPVYNSNNWEDLKNNQPFFAMINTPEVEYDIYDRKSVEKKRVKWVGEDFHPKIANEENVTPPPYYPDTEITRQEWARYLNSISGMDIRIGWILDQLKKEGLMENTVIIFFGDNGRLEARGIHWLWDTGIHVPMIVMYPEGYPKPPQYNKGGEIHDVLSLLDITATTLSIAGVAKPEGMQSRVFFGEKNDPKRKYAISARDRIDETVDWVRSIRGDRYHYIRNFLPGKGYPSLNRYKEKCFLVKPLMREMYQEGKLSGAPAELMESPPYEMLYDTELDPHEINNLVNSGDTVHQKILIEMRIALDKWMEETGDLGNIMEPTEIVDPFEKEMHDWFGTPEWYLDNNQ